MSNSVSLTFPDGSVREYDAATTGAGLAESISKSLAKKAVAYALDGTVRDLSDPLGKSGKVEIVLRDDPRALELIRHDAAHVLAEAVQELWPGTQVTIGPVIENGFYYDFARNEPFTPEDLAKIEAKMREIVARDEKFVREVWDRSEAIRHFQDIGESYKAELIESFPAGEEISIYRQGKWYDLCRGPHLPSTGAIGKGFKLLNVAGAYWRGDSRNEMLQRIYGTAWTKKEDLAAYLHRIEEAEKRDHRKLGKQLDLFHTQDEAPGMVFWHPKGWSIWQQVEQYLRKVYQDNGYQEVKAPQILDRSLWERSGHWQNFKENMFTTESEKRDFAVKPMNCPGHVLIFNSDLRSYRDLPLRYGEFGQCHRNEPSGALHGIMRVRGFTQDDGHIFCTEEDIEAECVAFNKLALAVYKDFGFSEIVIKLALRPEQRLGDDATWDRAEDALRSALRECGVEWTELPGEGAFYGPKIEYHLKDSLGRSWQCGTMQVDFQMPGRLGAEYVAADDTRRTPVMLHRAIVGSLERFIGILIENYAGALPLWLAPQQVVVLNITDRTAAYAQQIVGALKAAGFRAAADLRNEKITYKIREHSLQKLPYQLIVGDKEQQANTVAVRTRGGEDLGAMPLDALLERLRKEVAARS
jgi:threonyl-tRNA synthetase